jgi:hypothetical protein
MGCVINATPRLIYTPRKDPVLVVQEVWTGAENLVPTGIRPLDRPACSESL